MAKIAFLEIIGKMTDVQAAAALLNFDRDTSRRFHPPENAPKFDKSDVTGEADRDEARKKNAKDLERVEKQIADEKERAASENGSHDQRRKELTERIADNERKNRSYRADFAEQHTAERDLEAKERELQIEKDKRELHKLDQEDAKTREQNAEKMRNLENEIADIRDRHNLDRLNTHQRIVQLTARYLELLKKADEFNRKGNEIAAAETVKESEKVLALLQSVNQKTQRIGVESITDEQMHRGGVGAARVILPMPGLVDIAQLQRQANITLKNIETAIKAKEPPQPTALPSTFS